MSGNTVKADEIKALPFFARFLEKQTAPESTLAFPTLKYPSDEEDVLDGSGESD